MYIIYKEMWGGRIISAPTDCKLIYSVGAFCERPLSNKVRLYGLQMIGVVGEAISFPQGSLGLIKISSADVLRKGERFFTSHLLVQNDKVIIMSPWAKAKGLSV